jgi:redox-sensitive bicupin YhaK (pirin superfamily)
MPTTLGPAVVNASTSGPLRPRPIVSRTRGSGHGGITRLMSPSDLGQQLKPFVFLDLFDGDSSFAGAMPVHPHSGIGTVTLLVEGNVNFDDPHSNTAGTIGYGGVEWMRAGNGVWHGQEMTPGTSSRMRGYQLWVAFPAGIENGPVDSQYIEAEHMPTVGPARLILGSYESITSPVRSPAGINYLLVTLKPGELWTYTPPPGHRNAFISLSRGRLSSPDALSEGELAVFASGEEAITFLNAAEDPAVFVLGTAVPHPYELALGYYSVHTSEAALARGEARIAELRQRMLAAGALLQGTGGVPVFR